MLEARRRSISAGEPARAWAGFVVLGDGDYAPLSAAVRSISAGTFIWTLAFALLIGTALWAWLRFGRE
jgi:hypothetical protein